MFDFINDIDFNTIFSGASVIVGSIVIFMLKAISKHTSNTIDDKVVEAFEIWYKNYRKNENKNKK